MKTSYGSGLFGGQKTITNASDENSSEESQVGAANIFNGAQKPPAAPAPKQEQSFAQMQSAGYARPAPMPFTGPSAPRQVDDDDEEELARRVRAQLAAQQAQQQAQQGSLGVQRAAETLPVLNDADSAQRQMEQEQQQRMAQQQQQMQMMRPSLEEVLRKKLQADNGKLGGPNEGYSKPPKPDFNLPADGGVQSSVPDAVREKLQAGGGMFGGPSEGYAQSMSRANMNLPAGGGAPPDDGVVPTGPTTTPNSRGVAPPVSAGIVRAQSGSDMSTEGDSANSFRGYVNELGGGYGAVGNTLQSLQETTGVDPSKFGFNAQTNPAEIQAASRVMASMANGDPAAMQQGLQSSNAFIRQTAANQLAKGLTMNDTQQGAARTIQQLPPELRALVQKAYVSGNPYVTGDAGYDAKRGTGAQDALYGDSWSRVIDKPISDKTDPAVVHKNLVMGLGGRISGEGKVAIPDGKGGYALEGNVNDPAFLAKVQEYSKGKTLRPIIQDPVAPEGVDRFDRTKNWTPALPDAVKDALGGSAAGGTQGGSAAAGGGGASVQTGAGGGGASVQTGAGGGGQGTATPQGGGGTGAQGQTQGQGQGQAQGQGQPQAQGQPSSGLNSELERRVQEAMSAPGRYDEATVKNLRAQQRAELDAGFAGQLRAEKERLAQRGLAASSIGFEKESGLAGQQARAIAQMEGDLTTRVADAMAQDRQAAIANAMGLRSQTSQESQFGRQLASQESQFGKQFGLDERKVTEATRQFNANLSAESDRFAKTHGLDTERFKASNDQFQQNLAMQKDQFGQQMTLSKEQVKTQAEQFGRRMGFDEDTQKEIFRQANIKLDRDQQDRVVAILEKLPANASQEDIERVLIGAGIDPKYFPKPKSQSSTPAPTPAPTPTPTPNTPVGAGSGSTTINDYYDLMNRDTF